MGLLDRFANLDETQTQGLLAAASNMLQNSGPSRTPVGFGQIVGGGLEAYQGSTLAAKRRKMEEEQAQQMAAVRAMQVAEMQQQMQGRDAVTERNGKIAAQLRGLGAPQAAQQGAPDPITLSSTPMASFPGQAQGPQSAPMSSRQQELARLEQAARVYEENEDFAHANNIRQHIAAMTPKADWQDTLINGKAYKVPLFSDGNQGPVTGLETPKELHFADGGGKLYGQNRFTGAVESQIGKSITPDQASRVQVAAANRAAIQARSGAGSDDGLLPDDTVAMMAEQYRAGDTSVLQNLGRGAQGSKNIIRLRQEITRQAKENGQGGRDLAAQNAEYFGTKAGQRTAGTRIANVEMAASEAENLIPLARAASAEVVRSGFLPFGKAQMFVDNQTNNPAMRKFVAANNSLVNVYARAISPSGTPTVSDKEHAREMLMTAYDDKSYQATIDQMQAEITAARAAPKSVRKEFNEAVTGHTTNVRKYNPKTGKIE